MARRTVIHLYLDHIFVPLLKPLFWILSIILLIALELHFYADLSAYFKQKIFRCTEKFNPCTLTCIYAVCTYANLNPRVCRHIVH